MELIVIPSTCGRKWFVGLNVRGTKRPLFGYSNPVPGDKTGEKAGFLSQEEAERAAQQLRAEWDQPQPSQETLQ